MANEVEDQCGSKTDKKSYFTKKGFKRGLILLCVLTILGIIHTIIQRLSDANVNKLFSTLLATEMKSIGMLKNISANWKNIDDLENKQNGD